MISGGYGRTFEGRSWTSRLSESPLRRLDWTLVCVTVVLSAIGAVLVFSATRVGLTDAGDDPYSYLKKHLFNVVIGLVLGGVTAASVSVAFISMRETSTTMESGMSPGSASMLTSRVSWESTPP